MNDSVVIRIFDFDDTLAMSKGFIRVLHYENGAPSNTGKWLLKNFNVEGEEGPLGSIEISTGDYVRYAKPAAEMARDGRLLIQNPGAQIGEAPTDVIDYSGVSKIISPKPIEKNLKIMRDAFSRGEIVGIVTGRSGSDGAYDITGKWIKINNRDGISRFLARNGIAISKDDIYCVGHMPGGVPHNKAEIVRSMFIEKYNPEIVIFYDDDDRNLSSVSKVDRRVHCIDAKSLDNWWGSTSSVVSTGRERRKSVSSWSSAGKKSGLDR